SKVYLTPQDIETAEANGITEERAKARFYQLNWSKHRAITQPCKRPKGLWPKYKDICAEHKVSQTTFFYRINHYGMTPDEAATKPPLKRGEGLKQNHKITPEIREVAAKNGISKQTLAYRVYALKWPVERAMTEPINE